MFFTFTGSGLLCAARLTYTPPTIQRVYSPLSFQSTQFPSQILSRATMAGYPKPVIPKDSFLHQSERGTSMLNSFIADTLQPDEDFHECCGMAVDQLVKYLQLHVPVTVKKVIKVSTTRKSNYKMKHFCKKSAHSPTFDILTH